MRHTARAVSFLAMLLLGCGPSTPPQTMLGTAKFFLENALAGRLERASLAAEYGSCLPCLDRSTASRLADHAKSEKGVASVKYEGKEEETNRCGGTGVRFVVIFRSGSTFNGRIGICTRDGEDSGSKYVVSSID